MSAQRFRRRGMVEAWRFTGDADGEMELWLGWHFNSWLPSEWGLELRTPDGGYMRADAGDWIVRDDQGSFYPCKPGILDAMYVPEPYPRLRA